MPAKNIVKQYVKDGIYHIYNRGIEKRKIFLDDKDYKTFLHFLKLYLLDPETFKSSQGVDHSKIERNNFSEEIELLTYCLMPNHFHLLLKQKNKDSITRFMRCIATNYSMYFNKRYKRIGKLFQGAYKASLIKEDNYLLHLSKYIHLNPFKDLCQGDTLEGDIQGRFAKLTSYDYSSYEDYLGKKNTKWLKPDLILEFFKSQQRTSLNDVLSYQSFVEDYNKEDSKEIIGGLTLED